LQSVANAAGQATQFTLYDRLGRVLRMVDPKGITTDIVYTPRGQVSTLTTTSLDGAARTTHYNYDAAAQLVGVSMPDGTSLGYSYDGAHRLTGVTDARGNSVTYTLDAAGNRVKEDVRDASGSLKRTVTRAFDALDRLQQVTGAVH
jgi:YD repeat-containing protein